MRQEEAVADALEEEREKHIREQVEYLNQIKQCLLDKQVEQALAIVNNQLFDLGAL